MSVFIIFAIGCFFGAFLFNFNVGWGDKGAKEIRNALAGAGIVFLLIPIVSAIIHGGSQEVGSVLMIGALPLVFIAIFLGGFAELGKNSSSKGTYSTAMKGAFALVIIALVLVIIGAIINLTGGAI